MEKQAFLSLEYAIYDNLISPAPKSLEKMTHPSCPGQIAVSDVLTKLFFKAHKEKERLSVSERVHSKPTAQVYAAVGRLTAFLGPFPGSSAQLRRAIVA